MWHKYIGTSEYKTQSLTVHIISPSEEFKGRLLTLPVLVFRRATISDVWNFHAASLLNHTWSVTFSLTKVTISGCRALTFCLLLQSVALSDYDCGLSYRFS